MLDVPLRALTRVDALLDRGVLGGQAERVESLRVQHVHAVAGTEARDDIADRVDQHVPYVQRARRVREHLEDVALRPALLVRDVERLRIRPDALPALLDRLRVVRLHRLSVRVGVQKSLSRERPGGIAAAAPRSVPELCKKLGHELKTVPGRIRRCSTSSRTRPASKRASSPSAACRPAELAERFGTPLVVYCEETIRRQAHALGAAAGDRGRVFYGTKAFPERRRAAAAPRRRSRGRRRVGRRARIRAPRPHLRRRARRARKQQGRCVAPRRCRGGRSGRARCADEAALAAAAGVRRVLVRVTLGVDADTHEAIVTGHHGSKFGLPPAEARAAVAEALASGLDVLGLHVHVGSQLPDFTAQAETIRRLAAFAAACRDELGWEARVADLGGGFGIRHHPDDDVPDAAELARAAAATGRERIRLRRSSHTASSGSSRDDASSARPASRSIASAPSSDSPSERGSRSTAACPTTRDPSSTTRATRRSARPGPTRSRTSSSASRACTASPATSSSTTSRFPRRVETTCWRCRRPGAYTLAMSSNYNGVPRPAAILVRDGERHVIRRRETVDDLLALEA